MRFANRCPANANIAFTFECSGRKAEKRNCVLPDFACLWILTVSPEYVEVLAVMTWEWIYSNIPVLEFELLFCCGALMIMQKMIQTLGFFTIWLSFVVWSGVRCRRQLELGSTKTHFRLTLFLAYFGSNSIWITACGKRMSMYSPRLLSLYRVWSVTWVRMEHQYAVLSLNLFLSKCMVCSDCKFAWGFFSAGYGNTHYFSNPWWILEVQIINTSYSSCFAMGLAFHISLCNKMFCKSVNDKFWIDI